MSKKTSSVLPFIILLAFILRIAGVTHGFPFIFHPDEPTIIKSALAIRFNPNPDHFDWPHLYVYVNFFLYMFFARMRDFLTAYGFKDYLSAVAPIIWNDDLIFYLLTRVLTAVVSALTVIPIYLASKNLFGEKAGILSALLFSILPFHIWHSHYSLPDIPMIFFMSWAFYFATKIYRESDLSNYILGGLMVGFSASSKYNGAVSALVILMAHIFRFISQKVEFKKVKENFLGFFPFVALCISGLFSIFGFLLGTPFAVLDFNTFIRTDGPKGALWQFKNVGVVTQDIRLNNFFHYLTFEISKDVGYTILIGFFAYFILVLYRILRKRFSSRELAVLFLFITGILYAYYVAGFDKQRSHYYLILHPVLCIVSGAFLYEILQAAEKRIKYFTVLILLAYVFVPFYFAAQNSLKFYNGDKRAQAYEYIKNNLTDADFIVYESDDARTLLTNINIPTADGFDSVWLRNSGYALLFYKKEEYLKTKIEFEKDRYLKDTSEVKRFDSKYNLGPDILILKYAR